MEKRGETPAELLEKLRTVNETAFRLVVNIIRQFLKK